MTSCVTTESNLASVTSSESIETVNIQKQTFHTFITMLALAGTVLCASPAMAIEEPEFSIVASDGDFEIRDYAPSLAAEVVVSGERDEAVSAGFRILAGYIFGGNQGSAKIAMTAPVTQSPATGTGEKIDMTAPVTQSADGANWRVRFMMPKSYTKATLPKPNDKRITFVEIPARRAVVLKFSGMWTDANLASKKSELAQFIEQKKFTRIGEPAFAFYDPPWKPFFWRRNEVMQEIKKR